ncbi:hypothetical protein Taro_025438, partial [Colocasia esculenta]|nr:hypothetical protein [Colocasia esculenta]
LAVSSLRGRRRFGLVRTRAPSGFRSVFSRFRSPVLGCQSVVAPARVASRPRGVFEVRGGSACGPSTLWRSKVAVLVLSKVVSCFRSSCCSGRRGTGNPYWALFMRLTPLLSSVRCSSSRELGVRRVAEATVAPCAVSSSESSCT